jgi:hypothetical protein
LADTSDQKLVNFERCGGYGGGLFLNERKDAKFSLLCHLKPGDSFLFHDEKLSNQNRESFFVLKRAIKLIQRRQTGQIQM